MVADSWVDPEYAEWLATKRREEREKREKRRRAKGKGRANGGRERQPIELFDLIAPSSESTLRMDQMNKAEHAANPQSIRGAAKPSLLDRLAMAKAGIFSHSSPKPESDTLPSNVPPEQDPRASAPMTKSAELTGGQAMDIDQKDAEIIAHKAVDDDKRAKELKEKLMNAKRAKELRAQLLERRKMKSSSAGTTGEQVKAAGSPSAGTGAAEAAS